MYTALTSGQLEVVKNSYINALINSMSLAALTQVVGQHLMTSVKDLDEAQLRDAVISQSNIETWNQLIGLACNEQQKETEG